MSTRFRRRERSPIWAPFDLGWDEVLPGAFFKDFFSHLVAGRTLSKRPMAVHVLMPKYEREMADYPDEAAIDT